MVPCGYCYIPLAGYLVTEPPPPCTQIRSRPDWKNKASPIVDCEGTGGKSTSGWSSRADEKKMRWQSEPAPKTLTELMSQAMLGKAPG